MTDFHVSTLTNTEAAELVGVHPRRIHRWVRRYPGLGRRIAGRWSIDREALLALAAGTPGTEIEGAPRKEAWELIP